MYKLFIFFQFILNFIWFRYLILYYPAGNWIETAKNIKLTNNVLCAELYVKTTGKYNKSCIKVKNDVDIYYINDNGKFDTIYSDIKIKINYFPKGDWYETAKNIEYFPNRVCAKLKYHIWFYNCIYFNDNDYLINNFGQFKKLNKYSYTEYKYKN